jgi:hypothetical protein
MLNSNYSVQHHPAGLARLQQVERLSLALKANCQNAGMLGNILLGFGSMLGNLHLGFAGMLCYVYLGLPVCLAMYTWYAWLCIPRVAGMLGYIYLGLPVCLAMYT